MKKDKEPTHMTVHLMVVKDAITGIKRLLGIRALAVMSLTIMASLAAEPADLSPIGTMGKGERVLGGGREAVLFEHQGKGCLNHFWFGGNFDGVENTRIRCYVDGEKEPSIDMDL